MTTLEERLANLADMEARGEAEHHWTMFMLRHKDRQFGESDRNILTKGGQVNNINEIEAAYNNPDIRAMLSATTEDEMRERLVRQVLELLKRARSAEQLLAEEARLKYASIEALREQVSRLENLKALEAQPTRQLRKITQNFQRAQNQPPAIPATLTRIFFAKSMSTNEQRHALKYYGASELNSKWAREEGRA